MAASHLFASITFRKGVAPHQNFSTNPCVRRRTFLVFEEGQNSLCSKKDNPCVRRRIFLVFEEGHSLCSKKDIPCVRRRTFLLFEDDETPIFGRTDLRKGVSEAKFDAEVDFDVEKYLAPPKSLENHEKPKQKYEKFFEKNIWRQKIESCKSSETRFPEVSRRSERSSRGERKILMRRPSMQNQKYKTNGPSPIGIVRRCRE